METLGKRRRTHEDSGGDGNSNPGWSGEKMGRPTLETEMGEILRSEAA